MRIIAGERRGHKIEGPRRRGTRPTSDLVREALFNILRDEIEGRLVVDLFAGTGALGLEALSRGADRAIFVERDRDNAALIRRNLATLRFEDRGTVVPTDAYRWARGFEPLDDRPVVVLLDPPYRDYERAPGRVAGLLADLLGRLPEGSVVVAEAGEHAAAAALPEPEAWDLRRYGGTRIAVRRAGGVGAPADRAED